RDMSGSAIDTSLFNEIQNAKVAAIKLNVNLRQLNTARDLLAQELGGDRSTFVTDQVRLFYFTDVRRLLSVLNPTIHYAQDPTTDKKPESLEDEETASRNRLNDSDDSLADTIARV